jgi:hypothetical protein
VQKLALAANAETYRLNLMRGDLLAAGSKQ